MNKMLVLALAAALAATSLARAQSEPSLVLSANQPCEWKLDGRAQKPLKAEELRTVTVAPGEHRIEAATQDGAMTASAKAVVANGPQKIRFEFPAGQKPGESGGFQWTDPRTGSTWGNDGAGFSSDAGAAGFGR